MKANRWVPMMVLAGSLALVSLLVGCGGDGLNPTAPLEAPAPPVAGGMPGGPASVRFAVRFPSDSSTASAHPAAVRAVGDTPVSLRFQLRLFDIVNKSTHTLEQVATVTEGAASATFTNVPIWPVVARMMVENGTYHNATSFAGCLDLVAGQNTVVISPIDSLATTTLAALVMEGIASNPAAYAAVPAQLATSVTALISTLSLTSPSTAAAEALTAYVTALAASQLALDAAQAQALLTDAVYRWVQDVAMTVYSDFSSLAAIALPAQRATVVVPPLPATPPDLPTGRPTVATTTVLGSASATATTEWYLYVSPFDLTAAWPEWHTRWTLSGGRLVDGYGWLSAPVMRTATAQTRGFTHSLWRDQTLRLTTVGTGTYDTGGAGALAGTQVAVVAPDGTPRQVAYRFDLAWTASQAASGTIELADGGSIVFTRSAPQTSALGTPATYTEVTGTVTLIDPSRILTFTLVEYGDGRQRLTITSGQITTTLVYAADGSGTGSVTGQAGRGITLAWDATGAGTATITLLQIPYPVAIHVPPLPSSLPTGS